MRKQNAEEIIPFYKPDLIEGEGGGWWVVKFL